MNFSPALRFAASVCLVFLSLSCQKPTQANQLNNQVLGTMPGPSLFLPWSSRTILVCFTNLDHDAAYRDAIKAAVVREYERIGFDLSQGWGQCEANDKKLPKQPTIKIDLVKGANPRFGGSSAVGAVLGKLATISLNGEPLQHNQEFCRQQPTTCLQNWAVHEVGHSFGLAHTHQHPLADGVSMPMHVANSDFAFRNVNYLGDFDPQSIMSYQISYAVTELQPVDLRTLRALYEQPSVRLLGPAADRNGRRLSTLELNVRPLKFSYETDYEVRTPTHYRYKLVQAHESCNFEDAYGPSTHIDEAIRLNLMTHFAEGSLVKICVVGGDGKNWQDFAAHTNLIWQVGRDLAEGFDFSGMAHVDTCSGSLVRFTHSKASDPAIFMTNGHCLKLNPGDVLINQPLDLDIYPLHRNGSSDSGLNSLKSLQGNKVLYATLGVTDVALIEINKSYGDLGEGQALTLAPHAPVKGDRIRVVTSLFSEVYECEIEHIAAALKEGEIHTVQPMRFGRECALYHGTSGSPVIDRNSSLVVGITATGNDHGEACIPNNPCEIDANDQLTYKQGYGYALQTAMIYDCLREDGRLDFGLASCRLPREKLSTIPQ